MRRNAKVVDAPPDVLFSRPAAVAPPRILVGRVGMEMAEGVDEPASDDVVESGALFVGESGALAILFGPGEVDFAVERCSNAEPMSPRPWAQHCRLAPPGFALGVPSGRCFLR